MAENLKLAKALREAKSFFQGASNAAASNVSAPVDAIAWALRKAGVPVGDAPMGGSDWMRQHGLTAEAPGASGLIGESVGGVAPIVASAKAAQIAKGLLQAGENLATPATMNPQAGAIVFHGSPHKFEAFDSSKIGTGEGAQAYGHGLYLADSPAVAGSYKTGGGGFQAAMPSDNVMIDGKTWTKTLPRSSVESQAATVFKNDLFGSTIPEKVAKLRAAKMEPVADWLEKNAGRLSLDQGSLYKVDLPDEAIAKMLDYDKPLSQQAPEVQAIAAKRLEEIRGIGAIVPANPSGEYLHRAFSPQAGEQGFGQSVAAQRLREAGIPGIRYLDAGSRGQGQGSSNYVVFPGNESLLTILERNGQPLGTK